MIDVDVVGVGVGPANLSLITAMLEAGEDARPSPNAIFLERHPAFRWPPGLLLPESKLQIPFLKDLATQRNPRSKYTFLNYLFEQGRLEEFINLREFYPRLDEFAAYLSWIAAEASQMVLYAHNVTELRPAVAEGRIDRIEVVATSEDGKQKRFRGRAVVLATGHRPVLPLALAKTSDRIVHTASLLDAISRGVWTRERRQRFLIVGGGQSAAEAACYLLREFPLAHVELMHRSYALQALDDNPFVNDRYFSSNLHSFHSMGEAARRRALTDLSGSNFGVIDKRLLEELYRHHYEGKRVGSVRLSFLNGYELLDAETSEDLIQCRARDVFSGGVDERQVDGLIAATGYEEAASSLLRELDPWLLRGTDNSYRLKRNYRVESTEELSAAVFMHGMRQDSHGPTEASLSIVAVRGGILLAALQDHCNLRAHLD